MYIYTKCINFVCNPKIFTTYVPLGVAAIDSNIIAVVESVNASSVIDCR